MSNKDPDEERLMNSMSDNIVVMIMIKQMKLFQSLLSRYQIGLETTMKDSSFIFDHVHVLYYKYQKINPGDGR